MSDDKTRSTPDMLLGNRYRLQEAVGRGGMATVYRARDEVLSRDVAVKVFRSDTVDADEIRRQDSEMQVLARMNHHSLVTLFDAGTEQPQDREPMSYLVMEFVAGTDLHRRLGAGPLDPEDVRLLGADLADALHYIHRHGIVHRDIKPANILLSEAADEDERPRPKLTDFGIARIVDATRLTLTNTTMGTANYLSPEQARGEVVGPPTDIYSLGLVLLQCLTGVLEYPGSAVESAVARLTRDPRIPAGVGQPWDELLPRMTAREAADRPSARDVALALHSGVAAAARHDAGPAATRPLTTAVRPSSATGLATASAPAAVPIAAPAATVPEAPPQPPRVLPTREPAMLTNATQVMKPAAAATPAGRRRTKPTGIVMAALAAGALLLLGGIVAWLLALGALGPGDGAANPGSPASQAPSPVVPGRLGEHLDQLDESVRP